MLPNFNDLKYFIETCHTGNLTVAADKLRITQSGLSQSVQRLEQIIGASLLIRNKRGIKPTKAGIQLLSKSKDILDQWTHLTQSLQNQVSTVQGTFSIGLHQSVALYSLPLFINKLLLENAGLSINLTHQLSRKITEMVLKSEIDLGIVVNPINHPDLIIRELCTDEVTLWKHPDAKSNHTLILEPDLNQSQFILSKFKKHNLTFTKEIQSSSLEVIRMLVENKVGVGILPTRVAKNSNINLVHLSKNQPVFKDRVCLINRADGGRSNSLKTIIDSIIKGFK